MDDYAYLTTRVRAMEGDLLTWSVYQDLFAREEPDAWVETLSRTPYGAFLGATASRLSEVGRIEEAIRRSLSQAFRGLVRMAQGRPRRLLEILVGRWELKSLETILRGKRAQLGAEEILAATIPTAALDEPALAELARQPSLRAALEMLVAWRTHYRRPIRAFLRSGTEEDLASLEEEMERTYFLDALGWLETGGRKERVLREWIGLQIDRVNLLTSLRGFQGPGMVIRGKGAFLPGGNLSPKLLSGAQQVRERREAAERLRQTPYGRSLEGWEEWVREGDLSPLERAIDRRRFRWSLRQLRADPLGVGVLVGYVEAKAQEAGNLRLLLWGETAGLPRETAREMLLVRW